MTTTTPRHALLETADSAGMPTLEAPTRTPALRLSGVTVRHPDGTDPDGSPRFHTALDAANLEIMPGVFTAVAGPSGSGKSTLLSASCGLIVPDEGTVEVAGRPLAGLGEDERAAVRRENIGIVFQQANLMASLTAVEQLLLVANLSGSRGAQLRGLRGRARELLSLVGLEGLDDRRPHQLSGGQRQRVAIARALMKSPSLLLVDEPTSALDQEASARIVELLQRVTRELGPATVMVTHDEDLAARADRLVRVRDGRILA